MAKGKKTCKILKEIRRQIAEANDIEYVVEECQYRGDCLGTCPKCEAEVRYLEQQLYQRQLLGKAVVLAGVSVGMFTLSSCDFASSSQDKAEKTTLGEGQSRCRREAKVVRRVVGDGQLTGDVEYFDSVAIKEPVHKTVRGTAPVIKRDVEDECLTKEGEIGFDNPNEVDSPWVIKGVKIGSKELENGVYEYVEEMPSYPGGTAALMAFIQKNFKYPKEVEELGIQGRIVCTMVINEDGSISDIKVVKSVHPLYDAEFVRVIEAMPKWNPGKHSGKPVKVKYTIPMTMCFRN